MDSLRYDIAYQLIDIKGVSVFITIHTQKNILFETWDNWEQDWLIDIDKTFIEAVKSEF